MKPEVIAPAEVAKLKISTTLQDCFISRIYSCVCQNMLSNTCSYEGQLTRRLYRLSVHTQRIVLDFYKTFHTNGIRVGRSSCFLCQSQSKALCSLSFPVFVFLHCIWAVDIIQTM